MSTSEVFVISETPSLASALVELLEADGLPVVAVHDLGVVGEMRSVESKQQPPVLICASNGFHCESARRWRDGELNDSDLVVVGTRDPELRSHGHLHVVPLPLHPHELLDLVHSLLHN